MKPNPTGEGYRPWRQATVPDMAWPTEVGKMALPAIGSRYIVLDSPLRGKDDNS
ncbi:hypothetical protein [Phormidium sp. CCY1219]|uniref:hypothetical protein n=1 Tax=Phormidium sp. CCY1219 TaxID=2886104 RepID=UPI002D1F4E1C|nr:hypothetical protein [Phormidium sp. CCY1219]MEB3828211.1 hypothetical protein [Phormidium sp. CCY1219]